MNNKRGESLRDIIPPDTPNNNPTTRESCCSSIPVNIHFRNHLEDERKASFQCRYSRQTNGNLDRDAIPVASWNQCNRRPNTRKTSRNHLEKDYRNSESSRCSLEGTSRRFASSRNRSEFSGFTHSVDSQSPSEGNRSEGSSFGSNLTSYNGVLKYDNDGLFCLNNLLGTSKPRECVQESSESRITASIRWSPSRIFSQDMRQTLRLLLCVLAFFSIGDIGTAHAKIRSSKSAITAYMIT